MKINAYKITDLNNQTRNNTTWIRGRTVELNSEHLWEYPLCTRAWLHYFRSPVIAELLRTCFCVDQMGHRLWAANAEGVIKHDGWMKSGATKLTVLRRIPFPILSSVVRYKIALRCTLQALQVRGVACDRESQLKKIMQAALRRGKDVRGFCHLGLYNELADYLRKAALLLDYGYSDERVGRAIISAARAYYVATGKNLQINRIALREIAKAKRKFRR